MKKLGLLISLLLVLGILLSACSSGQQSGNATQGPTGLGVGETGAGTETIRETGSPYGGAQGTEVPGTSLATATREATAAVSGVATEAATSAATSTPRATSTTAPGTGTGTTTGTPGAVLPGTGRGQPALISELLDLHVRNNNGDDLGKVDNMVVDLGQQRADYVVLASGGFLGIGEKLILIPWNAMTVTWNGKGNDQNAFIIDLDKATLQKAPNFSTDQLPDISTPNWDANLRTFWTPYMRTGAGGTSSGTGAGSTTGTMGTGTPSAGSGAGASATGTPGAGTGGTGQATSPSATSAASGTGTGAVATAAAGPGTTNGMNRLVMAKDLLDYQIVGFASTTGATGGTGTGSTASGTKTPGASTGATGQATRPAATSTAGMVGTAMAPGVSTVAASGAAGSLGSVKDALVDAQTGQVTYLVIAANSSLGLGDDKMLLVPLNAVTLGASDKQLMLKTSQASLSTAPTFTQDQWPDFSATNWDQDLRSFWNNLVH